MEVRRVPAGRGWSWITEAWAIYKRNAGTWIGIYVVATLASLMLSFIPMVGWISSFLNVLFVAGVLIAVHLSEKGLGISVSNLFDGFKSGKVGSLLGVVVILALLIVPATLIVMGAAYALFWGNPVYRGFILNFASALSQMKGGGSGGESAQAVAEFVSGPESFGFMVRMSVMMTLVSVVAVVLFMLYWYAPAAVIFEGKRAWESMKKSYRMCAANVLSLTVYGLASMALLFLAVLPLGLGLLIMGPLMYISHYTSYRDMVGGRVSDPVSVLGA